MAPFLKICYHMTHPTINFNKMGLLGPLRVVLTTYVLADDDVCNARMPAASLYHLHSFRMGNKYRDGYYG